MTSVEIGGVIRRTRERLGLTQDGLGALVGADPNLVGQWEWGEARPDPQQTRRLAEVLGLPPETLEPDDVVVDVAVTPATPVAIRVEASRLRTRGRRSRVRGTRGRGGFGLMPGARPVGTVPHLAPVFSGIRTHLAALGEDRSRLFVVTAGSLVAILLALGVGTLIAGERAGSTAAGLEAENVRLEGELAVADAERTELAGRVGDLESAIADETARADEAADRLGTLEADNERLAAENDFLRGAVVISSASPFVDLVAITFDGGASLQRVRRVIDILDLKGATATFFPDGRNVESLPGIWELAVERGNELGNHTYAPVAVEDVEPGKLARQLKRWQDVVDAAIGEAYPTRWFRPLIEGPPGGYETPSDEVQGLLSRRGLLTVLWSLDTPYSVFDPAGPQLGGPDPTAEAVTEYLAGAAQAGSIIRLGFDDRDLDALPALIDALRGRGLEPVTLTELVDAQEVQYEGEVLPPADDSMSDTMGGGSSS